MGLQLVSCVWGDKHLELWRRTTLRSLAMPENAEALLKQDSCWNIYTEEKYFEYFKNKIHEYIPGFKSVELISTNKLRDRIDNTQSAMIKQIEKCLNHKDRMLLCPPDSIFGDGSVQGLLNAGRDPESVVVVPHPRVLPAILEEVYGSNAEMVSLSWRHLHRSWSEAEVGHPRQNSFIGGVSWSRVEDSLYSVTHLLPTPYLCDFTAEDLSYFKAQIGFGAYDHTWSGEILIPKVRQRFVGSSDIAFIAEITEADKNVPPIVRGGDPNKFWKDHLHNRINRQMISVFRGSTL